MAESDEAQQSAEEVVIRENTQFEENGSLKKSISVDEELLQLEKTSDSPVKYSYEQYDSLSRNVQQVL